MNMVLLMSEVENQRNMVSEEKTRSSQLLQEKMQYAQSQSLVHGQVVAGQVMQSKMMGSQRSSMAMM